MNVTCIQVCSFQNRQLLSSHNYRAEFIFTEQICPGISRENEVKRPQFPLVSNSACVRIWVRMYAEIWERFSKLRVLLCQHFLCLGFTTRPSAKRRARVYFWSQREGKMGKKVGEKAGQSQRVKALDVDVPVWACCPCRLWSPMWCLPLYILSVPSEKCARGKWHGKCDHRIHGVANQVLLKESAVTMIECGI